MLLNRILSTYTFRYAVVYISILSITTFIILGLIYASFSYDYFNKVNDAIILELEHATSAYEEDGVSGFESYVGTTLRKPRADAFYYLLVDKDFNRIAGNLDVWPTLRSHPDGWLSFERALFQDNKKVSDFLVRTEQLPDGSHILAARYYEDVVDQVKLVAGTLSQSMFVTILLGTLGALIISTAFVHRVDRINESINVIMEGDLSERIPADRFNSDLERLVYNLNKMLARIEQLMLGVKQVSNNVAHDLRTPLTRLRNNLASLESQTEPGQRQIVHQLIDEAESLLSTFNALLRISQVETRNRRSGFRQTNLKQLLDDVVELYEPLAMDKNIHLFIDRTQLINLYGDKDLLFQLIANILDNAIKYTPEQGQVRLSLSLADGQAILQIADTGVGVADDHKDKVFDRFFRVEASRSEQPGNGLGLSLVVAAVKLHDGEITLKDNYPGLRVVLSLPIDPANESIVQA